MKVPNSVRALFDQQHTMCARLKDLVDERLLNSKDARWHYESRLKQLISFAQKIETGRCDRPDALEDFLACTLVVANATEIQRADSIIRSNFEVIKRRPASPSFTSKASHAFLFDDLRLYARWKNDPALPPMDFGAVVFEIQIKTFLQHAWSVATHDLTYKTDEVSWSKERIAYQIKAMLEHAEVSIHEAELLSKCSVLPRQDRTAKAIQRIISVLRVHWPSDLPRDVRRLAETTLEHLELVKLKPGDLEGILTTGRDARAGQHPINLSPFATFLQYLLEQHTAKLIEALTSVEEKRKKVFIPAEVSLPPGIERTSLRNAIFPAVPVP